MDHIANSVGLDSSVLLDIVRAQTEIAKLGLDLAGVINYAVQRIAELTSAEGAAIEFAEGEDMVYRATSGIAASQLGLRIKRADSLAGLCVASERVVVSPDAIHDLRVDQPARERAGFGSMLVVPLKHVDTVVGALELGSRKTYAFNDRDVKIVELMSELIAAAMFHAAHYEASELYLRATHDALTGLPNRALFFDRLRQAMERARRNRSRLGVLNLDLDGLKPVNDQFGHRTGDAVICEAGVRMAETVRRSDLVARLGGDEFAVLMPDAGGSADVAALARRIEEAMAGRFEFEGRELTLSVSVGYAVFPDDGEDMNTVIEHADRAMYQIKRQRQRPRVRT